MGEALVFTVLVEAFGDGFDSSGVDEVMGTDGNRAGTGQHEFYGILPGHDTTEAQDGNGDGLFQP